MSRVDHQRCNVLSLERVPEIFCAWRGRAVKGRQSHHATNRSQSTLFPEYLDDYIAEDNPVRVIDVFVDELHLQELGFEDMKPRSHRKSCISLVFAEGAVPGTRGRDRRRSIVSLWLYVGPTGPTRRGCGDAWDNLRPNC